MLLKLQGLMQNIFISKKTDFIFLKYFKKVRLKKIKIFFLPINHH